MTKQKLRRLQPRKLRVLFSVVVLIFTGMGALWYVEDNYDRATYLCTDCAALELRTTLGPFRLNTRSVATPMSHMAATRGIVPPHAHRWECINANGGFVITWSCGLGNAANRSGVANDHYAVTLIESLDYAGERTLAQKVLRTLLDRDHHRAIDMAITQADVPFDGFETPQVFAAWWKVHGPDITDAIPP